MLEGRRAYSLLGTAISDYIGISNRFPGSMLGWIKNPRLCWEQSYPGPIWPGWKQWCLVGDEPWWPWRINENDEKNLSKAVGQQFHDVSCSFFWLDSTHSFQVRSCSYDWAQQVVSSVSGCYMEWAEGMFGSLIATPSDLQGIATTLDPHTALQWMLPQWLLWQRPLCLAPEIDRNRTPTGHN